MKNRIVAAALAVMAASSFGAVTLTDGDAPANFAMYSRGEIVFQSYSACHNRISSTPFGCSIAAELSQSPAVVIADDVSYATSMTVFSKGNINVYAYNDVYANLYGTNDFRNNAYGNNSWISSTEYPESAWTFGVKNKIPFPIVTSGTKDVYTQETLTKSKKYRTLTVKNGGTLIVPPGQYGIKNLIVEKGGKVKFTNPGEKTILNLYTLTWEGDAVSDNANPNADPGARFGAYKNLAKGIKVTVAGTSDVMVTGTFAGTLYAPDAYIELGDRWASWTCTGEEVRRNQNTPNRTYSYGRFVGNGISVAACHVVEGVRYEPKTVAKKQIAIDGDVVKETVAAPVASAKFVKQSAGVYAVDPSLAGSSYTLMDINGKVVNQGVLGSSLNVSTYPAIIRVQGMMPQYLK